MGIIKERFKLKADAVGAEIKDLIKEHGNKKIGEVTLSQIYQGMRGMTGLVSETSLLDAKEGIRFRGYSIFRNYNKNYAKAANGTEPLPEGLFHLMLIGDLAFGRRRTPCNLSFTKKKPCTQSCISYH